MANKGLANKRDILNRFENYEDRLLANQLLEMSERCRSGFSYETSDFLDPRQQKIAAQVLGQLDGVLFCFDGGIEGTERCLCIIFHEDFSQEDIELPIRFLKITWDADRKKLSHRDFLGSLMGSGIKREKLGDIILEVGSACIICDREISGYLLYNLTKVGSTPVRVGLADQIGKKEETVKVIHSTVASLRLDCIIGAGYHISRAKAQEVIKSGKVRLNWEETLALAKEVKEKDVVSLRGKGRILLEEVSGTTRKDRIKITIHKYT